MWNIWERAVSTLKDAITLETTGLGKYNKSKTLDIKRIMS